jgi:hypothetical protein
MPILEELGTFLQAHGFGSLGVDIFLGSFPSDAPGAGVQDAILGLFEIPGLPPLLTHDLLGPSVEQAMIQCRWRGNPYDYATTRAKAGNAFRLFATVVNQTLSGVFYQQILVRDSPFGLAADEWHRPNILLNIQCLRDGQAS